MTARKALAALLAAAAVIAGALIASREVLASRTGTWELSDFEDDEKGVFDD